jgi:GT2 family glycosyltransferase
VRKGQNPGRQELKAYSPEKLAIAALMYIPVEEGYFANTWNIFQFHLASVHQHTGEPFNYVVFDNGSCPAVRRRLEELHEQGWIDWLILSNQNLGKTGALNWMLEALPNEWICYSDSDMLFRPGWLQASWKIDASFPDCGMVGAQVVFPDREVDKGNTRFRNTPDPRFRFSQVKPTLQAVDEYCRGRNIHPERQKDYRAMQLDQVEDLHSGVKAYLGGNSHAQWLARRDVIRKILPLPAGLQLSREEDTFQDARMDELGLLHLTTTEPFLYHMGNTLDEELNEELNRLELPGPAVQKIPPGKRDKSSHKKNLAWRILVWLSRFRLPRRILLRLYNNLYQIFSS